MKKSVILLLSAILLACSSSDPDPCEKITCLNGGTCVNGQCKCSDRYEGPDCSEQTTPSKILLSKIEVTEFPATDLGGAGWDLTSGADIYVVIQAGSSVVLTTGVIENANPANVQTYSGSVIELSPTTTYSVYLYDDDGLDDPDYLGGIEGKLYSSTNEFPTVLTLDAGGAVAFKFTVEYEF